MALASFTSYGVGAWVVDFFRRAYELSYQEITVPLALINGVVYGLATWGGGALADRYGRRNKAAYGVVPAIGLCITIPAGLLSVWSPTAAGAFFFAGVNVIGFGLYLGPSFSLVQTLAPVRFRAFATAFYFFIINLFALGLGPLWVGWMSDQFEATRGADIALRMALSTLAVSSALAAIAYFWTARKVSADWARAAGD